MDTRYNDFAPRFGIAYSPDSKTVIRAGFGMFFSQDNGNSPYFDLARNLAVRNSYNSRTPRGCELFEHQRRSATMPTPFLTTGGTTVHVGSPYAYSDNPRPPHGLYHAVPAQHPAPVRQQLVPGSRVSRVRKPPPGWLLEPKPGSSLNGGIGTPPRTLRSSTLDSFSRSRIPLTPNITPSHSRSLSVSAEA